MRQLRATSVALAIVFAITVWFVYSTVLTGVLPDSWQVAAGAAVFAVAVSPELVRRLRYGERIRLRLWLLAGSAGVAVVFLAPLVVLSNRLSDAPPGSETLLFTTTLWGLLLVMSAAITLGMTRVAPAFGYSLVSILGTLAVLANWERPSSFSPLVRYPAQETMFLLAGVVWVAGVHVLSVRLEAEDREVGWAISGLVGAVAAVAVALADSGAVAQRPSTADAGPLLASAVSFALALWALKELAAIEGIVRASVPWFVPPAAVTVLGMLEQRVGPRGPDPVVWTGAAAGLLLILIGSAGVWATARPRPQGHALSPRVRRVLRWLVLAAVVASALTLAFPALQATVRGTLSNGEAYEASWPLLGFESAGGWVPIVAGVLLVSALVDEHESRIRLLLASGTAIVVVASYALLAETPLHTWTTWIPVEIQSEYGTEYALLLFEVLHDPLRIAALGLVVLAAIVVFTAAARPHPASLAVEAER